MKRSSKTFSMYYFKGTCAEHFQITPAGTAQEAECEPLGFISSARKLGVFDTHTCNSRSWEVDNRESEIQGHTWLQWEFEVSWS